VLYCLRLRVSIDCEVDENKLKTWGWVGWVGRDEWYRDVVWMGRELWGWGGEGGHSLRPSLMEHGQLSLYCYDLNAFSSNAQQLRFFNLYNCFS